MPGLEGRVLCRRYRVDEYVGGGGMADVYKVWDQHRSCHLAIKLMRQSLSEFEELGQRFKREADVLSRLQHPNIVRLYGFEQDEDEGLVFIVMDYVDGPTLASKLKITREPLPVGEVVSITDDVAAALTYAHNQNIYHRDIKPSNIIIARDGRAVLSDFGIARLSDALTMTYQGIGTPAYMSPEQCEGKEVGASSDIYSLGVVLYECLTGRRPFLGDFGRGEAPTTANIIKEHVEMPPPAPTDVNPSLRPQLEAVIVKALAKDPAYRYQSAAGLAKELRVAAGGTVLPALRVSTTPGGARVYVDGVLQGASPLELPRLAEGPHEVRVSARGFQDHVETIQVPEQRTLEIRLEAEAPAIDTTVIATPEAAADAGGAAPPTQPPTLLDRWRDWWAKPWFKVLLGMAGAAVIVGVVGGGFVLASGGGDDAAPPPATPTSQPSPTATATPALTREPTPTATPAPSPTPAPPPKDVTFFKYEGADAGEFNEDTGVKVTFASATDVEPGNGLLRVVFKSPDGKIAEQVDADAYMQEKDVNGDQILGDSLCCLRQQDDKSLQVEAAPGTYALSLRNVAGYEGNWNFGYQVKAGQTTNVVFIVSQLTVVVKNADGEPQKPYVRIYTQGQDVNETPIALDEITSDRVPDTGKVVFNLLPGTYWIELDDVRGIDWGRADNQVKPATRTDITLTLGRLVYPAQEYACLDVFGLREGPSRTPVASDDHYADACVDENFGAAVVDLVPGTYAVKIGELTMTGVTVVAGEETRLD